MLKQILTGAALIFVGLLLSVRGDEGLSESHPPDGSLANLIVSLKANCLEYQDPLFCFDWDSNELADLRENFFKTQSTGKTSPGNAQGRDSRETLTEFPQNHLHKRFLVVRRKNPTTHEYKRGPGFRSWGGKRGSMPNRQELDKRTKFDPWGGKRDDLSTSGSGEVSEKRAKFLNWGGKKTTNDLGDTPQFSDVFIKRGFIWKDKGFYLNEPLKKATPKRPQFQSWGGKRAPHPWRKILGFLNSRSPVYAVNGGEKRKFSSWGGKRYENDDDHVIRRGCQNWDSSAEDAPRPKSSAENGNEWKNDKPPFSYGPWNELAREKNNTR